MEQNICLTRAEFKEGLKLSNGTTYRITLVKNNFRVRVEIDPSDYRSLDDTFSLLGKDSSGQIAYQQVKSRNDDIVEGDGFVDLIFLDLKPELIYSFRIDPGKDGECYYAFEEMPWSELESFLTF
jgi:hypothetical protein